MSRGVQPGSVAIRLGLTVWGSLTALAALAIAALLIQGAICVVPDVQGNTLLTGVRRFDAGCFQAGWAMKAYLVLLDWQIGVALIVGLSALAWSAIAGRPAPTPDGETPGPGRRLVGQPVEGDRAFIRRHAALAAEG